MTKTKRINNFPLFITMCAMAVIFVASAITFPILNMTLWASTPTPIPPPHKVVTGGVLFGTTEINAELAADLRNLADRTDKTLRDFSWQSAPYYASNIAQIKHANHGILPAIQVFQDVGTMITQQTWYLAYISSGILAEENNRAYTFTFWSTGAIRNSTSNWLYENGNVRSGLVTDYANILTTFPYADNYITAPSSLPGTWQFNQPDEEGTVTNRPTLNGINPTIGGDKLWIPSSYEVGDGTVAGTDMWGMFATRRYGLQYIRNGFNSNAWLRSRGGTVNTGGNNSHSRTIVLGADSSSTAWGLFSQFSSNNYSGGGASNAVRPALHVTLGAML
jgi:hypothetical protein